MSGKLPRPSTPPGVPPASALYRRPSRLSFGTVCSSNINRSMEAHSVLQNAGLRAQSYGTGSQVRLPGRSAMEPQIFKFGTPYASIHASLAADDPEYFRRNGVLGLCERGAAVKPAPDRWQDVPTDDVLRHDVVICFEERIYDAVLEDLQMREPTENFSPILVVCLDTKDNPHEAAVQGQVCLELCWKLENQCYDLPSQGAEILEEFQEQRKHLTPIQILYQVCYL
jgi:RNA polymerase II subunit A C-terminal domain phosphatase SSU72